MDKKLAKRVVRACVRALTDTQAARLMTHAANETPIIHDERIWSTWFALGAG